MSCPHDDLKAYLLRELAEADRRGVESHLAACAECREELARLRRTAEALRGLPEEEIPHRIAFVSDKIFEPGGWARFWNSAPRLGFASAAMLAAAILGHALLRPAPAVTPEQMAALESRVRAEVLRTVENDLTPVVENFQVIQKRAAVFYRASLEGGSRP
jgi:anti-sigma factor RsiW